MKRTILAFAIIQFSLFIVQAQAPDKMSYQAVVRDVAGNLVSLSGVGVRISIINSGGATVYRETQNPTTNANGLFSIVIGNGNVQAGNISTINWAGDSYSLKSETDPAGGTNYTLVATYPIQSVPYALHAKSATTAANGDIPISIAYGSGLSTITGVYPNFTIIGTTPTGGSAYTAGSGISISGINQIVNTAPNQALALTGLGMATVTGAYPNFTVNVATVASPIVYSAGSNITISGNVISAGSYPSTQFTTITGIGTTILGSGTLAQTVIGQNLVAGSNVTISGNAINVAATNYTAGNGISISGTNQIVNTNANVALTGFGGTTITGTYPNFNIASPANLGTSSGINYSAGSGISISGINQIVNTAPNQTVALTGLGMATVTGAYPNFTVNVATVASPIVYSAGSNITISGNVISAGSSPSTQFTTITGIGTTVLGSGTLAQTIIGQNLIAGTNVTISANSINVAATNYTAGNGISITGTNQIVNTNANVALTGFGGTTVTGTYPNFNIASPANLGTSSGINYTAGTGISISGINQIVNTAPNQTVALSGLGMATVTGAYPNFTVNVATVASPIIYSAGSNITISGNVISAGSSPAQSLATLTGIGTTILGANTLSPTIIGQNLVAGGNVTISGGIISASAPIVYTGGTNVTVVGGVISASAPSAQVFTTLTGIGTTILGIGTFAQTVVGQNLVAGSNVTISGNAINVASPTPFTTLLGINGISVTSSANSFSISGNAFITSIIGIGNVTATKSGSIYSISGVASQWSNNGQSIYYNTSFVGIGTTIPLSRLDVNGGVAIGAYAGVSAAPTNSLIVSGNVGIGNVSPGQALVVVGNSSVTGIGYFGTIAGLALNGASAGSVVTVNGAGKLGFGSVPNSSQWVNTTGGIYYNSGKVGIGTATPGYTFETNGDIAITTFTGAFRIANQVVLRTDSYGNIMTGQAGNSFMTGSNNVLSGLSAGAALTSGAGNIFSGFQAGLANNSGSNNIFHGQNAGYSNTSGSGNIFSGYAAGQNNTNGGGNLFLGSYAGQTNGSGSNNIALGNLADVGASNLSNAAAIGYQATVGGNSMMALGGTGTFAVKVGIGTGTPNQTLVVVGNSSVTGTGYFGTIAGLSLNGASAGSVVTVNGVGKLGFGTISTVASQWTINGNNLQPIGSYNINISTSSGVYRIGGNDALRYDATSGNLMLADAGNTTTSGTNNIFMQNNSGTSNTTGSDNIFMGPNAGTNNTTGYVNVFIGDYAGYTNTTGYSNLALGVSAGRYNTTGYGNVFSGYNAGNANTLGNTNIAIGYQADFAANNFTNAIAIGANAIAGASNTLVLGGIGANAVKVGIGTSVPGNRLDVNGGVAVGTYAGVSAAPANSLIVSGNVGIGVVSPNAPLQFPNSLANRKIVFYDFANNDHQFIGFGLSAAILRYQTDNFSSDHVFYAGSSSTTSTELMRIKGTGNVGIGTTIPGNKLDVKGGMAVGTYAGINTAPANSLIVSGNVGIGTSTPFSTLQVVGNLAVGLGSNGAFIGVTQLISTGLSPISNRMTFGTDNTGYKFAIGKNYSGTVTDLLTIQDNGNVGIGTTAPSLPLHVVGNDVGQGPANSGSVAIGSLRIEGGGVPVLDIGIADDTYIGSTLQSHQPSNQAINYPLLLNPNGGNVGIGITTPTQRLDVNGSVNIASTGVLNFGGVPVLNTNGTGGNNMWANIRVIGNASTSTQDGMYIGYGNTGGVAGHLRFYANGTTQRMYIDASTGYVGIGTTSAAYPLDINGDLGNSGNNNTKFFNSNNVGSLSTNDNGLGTRISVRASGGFLSSGYGFNGGFYVTSDERIKRKVGVSDSRNDLATLMKLKVTDYKYVDSLNAGITQVKGVFAQEVETIYPQAISKQTNFIPNIYSLATKVIFNEMNKTLTVSLAKPHDLKIGDKVKLISSISGEKLSIVTSIDDNSFTVSNWSEKIEKIFVFGKEVNDFRIVDYDKLFTLNISATQELAHKLDSLKTENEAMKLKLRAIDSLSSDVNLLKKLTFQQIDIIKNQQKTIEANANDKAELMSEMDRIKAYLGIDRVVKK